MKREKSSNIFEKPTDVMRRFHERTTTSAVFSFIAYSCNGMREVILQSKFLVKWGYGCCTHFLHNLSPDMFSLEPFKNIIKNALYVSITVNNTGMVRNL